MRSYPFFCFLYRNFLCPMNDEVLSTQSQTRKCGFLCPGSKTNRRAEIQMHVYRQKQRVFSRTDRSLRKANHVKTPGATSTLLFTQSVEQKNPSCTANLQNHVCHFLKVCMQNCRWRLQELSRSPRGVGAYGAAKMSPREAKRGLPVTKVWWSMPLKASMARRPFFSSFSRILSAATGSFESRLLPKAGP